MESATNNNAMESGEGDSLTENWIEARESASIVIPLHTTELSTIHSKNETVSQKCCKDEIMESNLCNLDSNVTQAGKSVDAFEHTDNTSLPALIVPVFCPLCSNYEVRDPVVLHFCCCDAANSKWCVACKECVANWFAVSRICNDEDENSSNHDEEDVKTANTVCCPICRESITFPESFTTNDKNCKDDDERNETFITSKVVESRNNCSNNNSNNRSGLNFNAECVNKNFPLLTTVWPEVTIEWMQKKENVHTLLLKLNNVNTNGDVNRVETQYDKWSFRENNNNNNKNGKCNVVENCINYDNGVIAINTHSHDTHLQDCVCGVCEVNKASVHCCQCGFALCTECIERTHTKGRFKEHELCSTSRNDKSDSISIAPCKRYCTEHSDQTLELYCKTCQLPTCVHCCFAGPHRTHDVIPITEMSHNVEVQLACWQDSLMQMADTAKHALDVSNNSIIPAYQRAIEYVENDITSAFSTMHAILHDRERALCDELYKNSNLVKDEIGQSVAGVDALHTTLHTVHNNIDSLHHVTDIVSLIQSSVVIDSNCKYLTHVASSVLRKIDCMQNALLRELVPPIRSRSTDLCASDNDKVLESTQKIITAAATGNPNADADAKNINDKDKNDNIGEKNANIVTPNALVSFSMSTENTAISLAECVEFFASLGDLHVASTLHNITKPQMSTLEEQPNESYHTEQELHEPQKQESELLVEHQWKQENRNYPLHHQEQEKDLYKSWNMKQIQEQNSLNCYNDKSYHSNLSSNRNTSFNSSSIYAPDNSNGITTSSKYGNEISREDAPPTKYLSYEPQQQLHKENYKQQQKQKERFVFSAIDSNAPPSTFIKSNNDALMFSRDGVFNSLIEPRTQLSSKWLSRSICTVASTGPPLRTERFTMSETNSNTNVVEHGQKRQREQTACEQHEMQVQNKLVLDL